MHHSPRRVAAIAALALGAGCGEAAIDPSREGLTALVKGSGYRSWRAEGAVHDSGGPHGKVRAYFNGPLAASLAAGTAVQPRGSCAVKELYASDGTTLVGHAVEVKAGSGSGRDAWIWFEALAPDYVGGHYGQADPACADCHSAGTDYVVSDMK